MSWGWWVAIVPVFCFGYAYFGYPGLLWLWSRGRPPLRRAAEPEEWPSVTVVLPVYNEVRVIGRTLDSLLAIDYPKDRFGILVVSDASTDGTDEAVRGYADRGVELLRLAERSGKTGAENAAAVAIRGEIVINTDATIRILPDALKPLVASFTDPTVGVASGRDVSVGALDVEASQGESRYVGYEMWLRGLETRCGGIVGASGCFYANRRHLHDHLFPTALSRDFASALIAIEHGYRAISVDEAVCLVPRAASLEVEYRRKTRTMARGLETLWYKRALLNPFRYGRYSWMLFSHKLARWLVFLTAPLLPIGLAIAAPASALAKVGLAAVAGGTLVAWLAWKGPQGIRDLHWSLRTAAFGLASSVAGLVAWTKAIRGELNPVWEPTRRPDMGGGKAG